MVIKVKVVTWVRNILRKKLLKCCISCFLFLFLKKKKVQKICFHGIIVNGFPPIAVCLVSGLLVS